LADFILLQNDNSVAGNETDLSFCSCKYTLL